MSGLNIDRGGGDDGERESIAGICMVLLALFAFAELVLWLP